MRCIHAVGEVVSLYDSSKLFSVGLCCGVLIEKELTLFCRCLDLALNFPMATFTTISTLIFLLMFVSIALCWLLAVGCVRRADSLVLVVGHGNRWDYQQLPLVSSANTVQ